MTKYLAVYVRCADIEWVYDRCALCGSPIAGGETCRDYTGVACQAEEDFWHDQYMQEQMQEEERRLEEQEMWRQYALEQRRLGLI